MTNLRKILALAIAAVLAVAAASASAHTMKMKISTPGQGKSQITTVDGSGKCVTSECGSLTPMAVPKK